LSPIIGKGRGYAPRWRKWARASELFLTGVQEPKSLEFQKALKHHFLAGATKNVRSILPSA
jgi:hypothetical protein